MVLGHAVSTLEKFVWISNHVSIHKLVSVYPKGMKLGQI